MLAAILKCSLSDVYLAITMQVCDTLYVDFPERTLLDLEQIQLKTAKTTASLTLRTLRLLAAAARPRKQRKSGG